MDRKRTVSENIFGVINNIIMALISIICLYPFLYVIFASMSEPNLLVKHSGILLRPAGLCWDGYKAVASNKEVIIGYINTIIYVVVGTTLSTLVTALLAYPLTHPRLKYKGLITKMIVISMFFSGGMIPTYLVVKGLGMINTRWSIIIPGLISAYNVLIMKAGFASVPPSLEESAKIDGANEFLSFIRVIVPDVKATIAIIALYYSVGIWNSWFSALLYLDDRTKYPLQLFLREILIQSSSNEVNNMAQSNGFLEEVIKHATTVVATIPILTVYPFVQKYFVKGVLVGAVKE